MKIAFLSLYDTLNINSYSGAGYYLPKSLEDNGNTIERIDSLSTVWVGTKIFSKVMQRLTRRPFYPSRTIRSVYNCGKVAEQRLRGSDADIILSTQFAPITFLNTNKPIFFWNDASFVQMFDFYSPAPVPFHHYEIKRLEGHAFRKARGIMFTSNWALENAANNYSLVRDRLNVVSYGLNSKDIEALTAKSPISECVNLLCVGVDWHRKGFDYACELVEKLNKSGIKVKLDMIGCLLPEGKTIPANIIVHGFLSKGVADQAEQIRDIYKSAHLLLLPTRADYTPMVIAEANSNSIPVLASDVGGIHSLINQNDGGYAFALDNWVENSFQVIIRFIKNDEMYKISQEHAFMNYKSRLTWKSASDLFLSEVSRLLTLP